MLQKMPSTPPNIGRFPARMAPRARSSRPSRRATTYGSEACAEVKRQRERAIEGPGGELESRSRAAAGYRLERPCAVGGRTRAATPCGNNWKLARAAQGSLEALCALRPEGERRVVRREEGCGALPTNRPIACCTRPPVRVPAACEPLPKALTDRLNPKSPALSGYARGYVRARLACTVLRYG